MDTTLTTNISREWARLAAVCDCTHPGRKLHLRISRISEDGDPMAFECVVVDHYTNPSTFIAHAFAPTAKEAVVSATTQVENGR